MNPAWLCLTVPLVVACQPSASRSGSARYLVTERVIDVGVGIGLCMAIDVNDPKGIWWWGPGRSGCASRSTGPGLLAPDGASVSAAPDGGHVVRFRLGTHSLERPYLDLRFLVESGTLRLEGRSDKVPLVPRADLEIPEGI